MTLQEYRNAVRTYAQQLAEENDIEGITATWALATTFIGDHMYTASMYYPLDDVTKSTKTSAIEVVDAARSRLRQN